MAKSSNMQNDISVSGRTDDKGTLRMFMGELNDFLQRHPNSTVVARFAVATKGSSAALRGYYYNYIVPTMQKAFYTAGSRYTEKQTEEYLRYITGVMLCENIDVETGEYTNESRRIDTNTPMAQLLEHIEVIKQIAAEEFNCYIADPNEL